MKKLFSCLVLVFSLFLAACGQTTKEASTEASTSKVQLVVKSDKTTTDETVEAKADQTVMDVLKANYEVKETDGFITAIDGVEQDEAAKKYWMFKVNGEVAPKAANQIKVKDGDKIEFYQETY